jgi:hypothetical protein
MAEQLAEVPPMVTVFTTPNVPAGIAFEIADLILIGCWAAVYDFEMLIRLDHRAGDDEYEEVVEFRTGNNLQSRWIMWRNAEAVFVQPILGRMRRYTSVATALKFLRPKQRVEPATKRRQGPVR